MDSLFSSKAIPEKQNYHMIFLRNGGGNKWPVANLTNQLEAGNSTHIDDTSWSVMALVFLNLLYSPNS